MNDDNFISERNKKYSIDNNIDVPEDENYGDDIYNEYDNDISEDGLAGTGEYGTTKEPYDNQDMASNDMNTDNEGMTDIHETVNASDNNVKKAFVLGVIDGRGTPDISISKGIIRYLSLDCPNDDIGDFLHEAFKSIGLLCNYNTARDRLEGGAPRKAQLRIKNVEDYMRRIGYISPAKFNNMKAVYMSKYGSAHESSGSAFMSGLKYLTR